MLVATVPGTSTAPPDPPGLVEARELVGRVQQVSTDVSVALETAFGRGRQGVPTPADYRRLRDRLIGQLATHIRELAVLAPGTDADVVAGSRALSAAALTLLTYLRHGAAARSPVRIAGFVCDLSGYAAAAADVAAASAELEAAGSRLAARFGVQVDAFGAGERAGVVRPRDGAIAGWACTAALRPLILQLGKARGAAQIVPIALAVGSNYRALGRGVPRFVAGASRQERTALAALRRWAAVEGEINDLIVRSWRKHDVTTAMLAAATARETAEAPRLLRALRAVGIRARLR